MKNKNNLPWKKLEAGGGWVSVSWYGHVGHCMGHWEYLSIKRIVAQKIGKHEFLDQGGNREKNQKML